MTIDRRWCGALPLILVLGCGGEGTSASASTSGGGGSGATSTSAGSGGAASTSTSSTGEGGATSSSSATTGSGGMGGGGSAPHVPACYNTCNTAADCATPGVPIYGVDNWACNGGKCDYLGCNSTKECTDTYMKPGYVCD